MSDFYGGDRHAAEEQHRDVLRQAIKLGCTFWDTVRPLVFTECKEF